MDKNARIIQGGLAVDFNTCFFAIKISSLCVNIYQDYHEDNTNMIFKIAIQKKKHTVFLLEPTFIQTLNPQLVEEKRKKTWCFFTHQSKPPMKYLFIRLLSSDRDQTVSQAVCLVSLRRRLALVVVFGSGVWESQNFLWCHCWTSF